MEITGKTRVFPIIGHPVGNVFSPRAFNDWFDAHGVDCRMFALDLAPEVVHHFLSLMRASQSFLGCSITHPHKHVVYSAVDTVTGRASRLGALNTIRREADGRLAGDATDGMAMVSAIEARGGTIEGSSAMILGAGGGAGRAIADALCERGISRLALSDLDPARLRNAKSGIVQNWPRVLPAAVDDNAEILVNASTVGLAETDDCPFGLRQMRHARIICDVITRNGRTSLIKAANDLGKLAIAGTDMGAAQLKPQLSFLRLGTDREPE